MIFTLPIATPVITPVELPAVTIPVPELQIPPVAVSLSAIVLPIHTDDAPVIVPADGVGLTVAVVTPVDVQLLASVTVNEYTPVAVVAAFVIEGSCMVEL